jgi:RNA polymerase sigma-70 factor (ECF subfamily)
MMPEVGSLVLPFPTSGMGRLAAAFLAARKVKGPEAAAGAGPGVDALSVVNGLEAALAGLLARGAAAHLDLSLDGALLATHLGRCGAAVDAAAAPASIHAEDLFLAAAALFGDAAAVAKLRRVHRPVLAGYLRHIDVTPAFFDEVEQRLWDALLVGGPGAVPKLAGYSGQGALAGWVGIAAQRIALMMRRHEAAEERAADGAAIEAAALTADPELAIIKGRLRDQFQGALTRALATLDDRERMIYRMHLLDGLTVEAIGKVYAVSHSTVSRWLAKAREGVIQEAQRVLRDEMRLSPAEFNSVAALVVSQLDLSVSRLLRRTG